MGLLALAALPIHTALAATGLLCLAMGLSGPGHSGYWANMIDISPNHAGKLLGYSNTIGTVPGIVANLFVGSVLTAQGDEGWGTVWLSAIVMYALGTATFARLAVGHEIWT